MDDWHWPRSIESDRQRLVELRSSKFEVDAICPVDPIPLLRDLVAANSVNPSLVPGAPGEAAAAEVARAAHARRPGSTWSLQEAAPGRPNVIGVLDGRDARTVA